MLFTNKSTSTENKIILLMFHFSNSIHNAEKQQQLCTQPQDTHYRAFPAAGRGTRTHLRPQGRAGSADRPGLTEKAGADGKARGQAGACATRTPGPTRTSKAGQDRDCGEAPGQGPGPENTGTPSGLKAATRRAPGHPSPPPPPVFTG